MASKAAADMDLKTKFTRGGLVVAVVASTLLTSAVFERVGISPGPIVTRRGTAEVSSCHSDPHPFSLGLVMECSAKITWHTAVDSNLRLPEGPIDGQVRSVEPLSGRVEVERRVSDTNAWRPATVPVGFPERSHLEWMVLLPILPSLAVGAIGGYRLGMLAEWLRDARRRRRSPEIANANPVTLDEYWPPQARGGGDAHG